MSRRAASGAPVARAAGAALARATSEADALGLYVHIPFCRSRCHYCDFNTYAGLDHMIPVYLEALADEIKVVGRRCGVQCGAKGRPIDTVYVGGGTPSVLEADQLARVLDACREAFTIDPDAEISVEANPDSLTAEKAAAWAAAGVTRVSLGAQSLDDGELAALGRRHEAASVTWAIEACRGAGVGQVGLDLMFGIPAQDVASWHQSLEGAVRLGVDHVSCYGLEVAPGTELARSIAAGETDVAGDDEQAAMFELADDVLGRAGFHHYEISNYARPGCECRHNMRYWHCRDYLGFGAGAHGSMGGLRWWNRSHPEAYVSAMRDLGTDRGESSTLATQGSDGAGSRAFCSGVLARRAAGGERLSSETRLAEAFMLGLRTASGVDVADVERRLGLPTGTCARTYRQELEELAAFGLLEHEPNGRMRLTPRGRLLANEVCTRFVTPCLDTPKEAVLGSS